MHINFCMYGEISSSGRCALAGNVEVPESG